MKKLTFLTSALLVVLCVVPATMMLGKEEAGTSFRATHFSNKQVNQGFHKLGYQSNMKMVWVGISGKAYVGTTGIMGLGLKDDGRERETSTHYFRVAQDRKGVNVKNYNYKLLDKTFGTNGDGVTYVNVLPYISADNFGNIGAAILHNDKIVLAGLSNSDKKFAIIRLTKNGILDASFANGGIGTAKEDNDTAIKLLSEALGVDEQEAQEFFNHMQK